MHYLDKLKIEVGGIAGNRKTSKKVRGPTFMCKVWGQHDEERSQVLFNNKGQPISNNSKLNHFLGTIARNRRYAPLQYKSWHKMPKIFKEDMFALVLVRHYITHTLNLACITFPNFWSY